MKKKAVFFAISFLLASLTAVSGLDLETTEPALTAVPKVQAELVSETSDEAKILIDDERISHPRLGGIASPWEVVKPFGASVTQKRPFFELYKASTEGEAYYKRDIFNVSDGILEFQFGASAYLEDGAFLAFAAEDGTTVLEIRLIEGTYHVLDADGTYTNTRVEYSKTMHYHIRADLTKGEFTLHLNGDYTGVYQLVDKEKEVSEVRYGVAKEAVNGLSISYAFLYHNYLMYEKFVNAPDDTIPYYVKPSGTVSKQWTTQSKLDANGGYASIENGNISGSFASSTGNVVFQTYMMVPDTASAGSVKIALTNNTSEVFSVTTANGCFAVNETATAKAVPTNLWNIVRIEANTQTHLATVKVNGKTVGTTYELNADAIDGYAISATDSVYVDDIQAFVKTEPTDYVPEPVIPTDSTGYTVGINVCSLWREGSHYGWEDIAAYPELEPVLGYYDEGNPEVSDWEIKMMVEHGIDFQTFCWWLPADTITEPIQRGAKDAALIDGYFNAKYSDKMKFAIMWENLTVSNFSYDNFVNYVVPYWNEYFFNDDRYLKINEQPVLVMYKADNLFADGKITAALNYLKTNYSCIILRSTQPESPSANWTETFPYYAVHDPSAYGYDGYIGYHWGPDGANADTQLKAIHHYASSHNFANQTVPTISVGFQNLGWGMNLSGTVGTRNGLLPVTKYPTLTSAVKEILTTSNDTYADLNMVNISTWNEYGEGTYVMPTAGTGFGYLDAIRTAFTDGGEHTDAVPTAKQKQRINYLYPQNRNLLRPQITETHEAQTFKVDICGEEFAFIKNPEIADGELLVPLFPESGILSRLMCTYSWNKADKILTVTNGKNTVVFTVGNKTATVNGSDVELANAVSTFDGLPVIPLNVLVERLGYAIQMDASKNTASIAFKQSDFDILDARKNGKFEFDVEGDLEGWTVSQHADILSKNGSLVGEAFTGDSILYSPQLNLDADANKHVFIRMKWDAQTTPSIQFYYNGTSNSKSQSLNAYHSNGEFVDIVFDMTNDTAWTGTIDKIRFDPLDEVGSFEIDYIRFGNDGDTTVSFHPASGIDGQPQMPAAVYGAESIDLTQSPYTLADTALYTFKGWSENGVSVIADQSNYIPTGNVVLYPVWEKKADLFEIEFTQYRPATETKSAGIRFYSLITLETVEASSEYGFIVTLEELLNDKEFTMDSGVNYMKGSAFERDPNGNVKKNVVYATKPSSNAPGVVLNDNQAVTAVIVGIPENAYKKNFVVRPYMVIGGNTYYSEAKKANYYDIFVASEDKETMFDAEELLGLAG